MPRIEMTRAAKVALFFLPLYLLGMLALIVIKFVRMLGHS